MTIFNLTVYDINKTLSIKKTLRKFQILFRSMVASLILPKWNVLIKMIFFFYIYISCDIYLLQFTGIRAKADMSCPIEGYNRREKNTPWWFCSVKTHSLFAATYHRGKSFYIRYIHKTCYLGFSIHRSLNLSVFSKGSCLNLPRRSLRIKTGIVLSVLFI